MSPMYGKYYNPKISLTMAKNAKRHMDRMAMEEVKRKLKEAARQGPRMVPKNPIMYDDNRTNVFNRKFYESIGFVMSQITDLLGKGICITKVNVTHDFSEVRVFWVAKEEKEVEVTRLLQDHGKIIRKGMMEAAGLGKLPMIVYVMDSNYLFTTHMDRLFDKLDVGPVSEAEENVWREVEQLEVGSDGGGLRRDDILGSVQKALLKSKALHRGKYSEEQFQTVYRETIQRHGGAHKLEVKNNIRKFLVGRNKANQRAREENKTLPVYFEDDT